MQKVTIQCRDKDIRCPETNITLFQIKEAYIGTGQLAPELTEALFSLIDFTVDRLIYTESERFRNNY